ncbi:hypothetical protein AB1K54_08130 [Microbacterium sp. BWT-B31]|uniref:variant leucine-rich repeat-containing protein n=1 Tax=Microbacterium sp. BWT-B31 TaxID=3232072 RepID=UPI003527A4F6
MTDLSDPDAVAVRNPATDGATLAEVAGRRPDLGWAVVWHPNAYDGLHDWLALRPVAAAEKALEGLAALDPVTLATSLAPSEVASLQPSGESLGRMKTADAVERFVGFGDVASIAEVLPLPERRLLSLYGDVWAGPDVVSSEGGSLEFTSMDLDPSGGSERVEARVEDVSFTLRAAQGEWDIAYRMHDSCVEWVRTFYGTQTNPDGGGACLSDISPHQDLALSDTKLIIVREGEGWLVSPLQTAATAAVRASSELSQIAAGSQGGND